VIPSLRVTSDTEGESSNPPLYLHGFTADFDTDTPMDEAVKLIKRNAAAGLMPALASQTFSGGIRLTWDFEEPVLIDNKDLSLRFLEELSKELRVKALIAGFDVSSLKSTQYFEAGTDWTTLPDSKPIGARILGLLFYRAATSVRIQGEGPQIPLEAVEEEVLKRWPQRVKQLKEGDRLPLFWIEPYEDRVGSQVGTFGMLCYSTRAGKSFVSWGEILGTEFTREYEAKRVGAAADEFFYDGRHYWRHADSGSWVHSNKEDTIMYLKTRGISPRPSAKKFASEAEEVLVAVQDIHRVAAAAPLVHDARRIAVIDGERYLNISTRNLIKPTGSGDPAQFPWLHEFFNRVWSEPREIQRDHYLGWLQYAYRSCLEGKPGQGHAVFVSGPKSSGKTFLNFHILGSIFGGFSDSSEFLMGKTNFNKADAESYIWAIDDSKGASSWEARGSFSANLKKHVANPRVRVEAKGKDSFTIPWRGRISITCNLDKESRSILPQVHGEILDKICMFEWNCWRAKFLPNGGTEDIVMAEMPHFLQWLCDWKTPDYVASDDPRFGVQPFHHPSMLEDARENSGATRLSEMLEMWKEDSDRAAEFRKKGKKLWLTGAKLKAELSREPSFRDSLNKELGRERLGQSLQELGVQSRPKGGSKEYLIFDPKAV
jgi:hypothetical protein